MVLILFRFQVRDLPANPGYAPGKFSRRPPLRWAGWLPRALGPQGSGFIIPGQYQATGLHLPACFLLNKLIYLQLPPNSGLL